MKSFQISMLGKAVVFVIIAQFHAVLPTITRKVRNSIVNITEKNDLIP